MTNHRAHHEPFVSEAEEFYDLFLERIQNLEHGQAHIEVYIFGILIRTAETAESMFQNANGAPDNTLPLLLRHVFENVVRMKYLTLYPELALKEFEYSEVKSRLNIIGQNPQPNELAETTEDRERLVPLRDLLKGEIKLIYETPENRNPPELSIKRMFEQIGEAESYTVYALLSQYEHSTGVGLMGSVVNHDTKKLAFDQKFDDGRTRLIWSSLVMMLEGAEQAIAKLDSLRPFD